MLKLYATHEAHTDIGLIQSEWQKAPQRLHITMGFKTHMQGKPKELLTAFVSFFFLLAFLAGFSFAAGCSPTTRGLIGVETRDSSWGEVVNGSVTLGSCSLTSESIIVHNQCG